MLSEICARAPPTLRKTNAQTDASMGCHRTTHLPRSFAALDPDLGAERMPDITGRQACDRCSMRPLRRVRDLDGHAPKFALTWNGTAFVRNAERRRRRPIWCALPCLRPSFPASGKDR